MNIVTQLILLLSVATWIEGIPINGRITRNMTRFQRATSEEFETSLEHMQRISRITNGIYLQQGLIKGSIPPAELIPEILNFGATKLTDIHEIEVEKLEGVVKKIGELPGELKSDNDTIRIENRLALLKSIVDLSNGVKSLVAPDNTFKTEVEKLKKFQSNAWTSLRKYSDSLEVFVKTFWIVRKNEFHEIEEKEIKNKLNGMTSFVRVLKGKNFTKLGKSLKAENAESFKKPFIPFLALQKSMSKYADEIASLKYDPKTDDVPIGLVESNFKEMNIVIEGVKATVKSLNTLQLFFGSRHYRSGDRALKHTPAFAEGPSELKLISRDLKDDWIQQVIGEEKERMEAALNQVARLGDLSADCEKAISSSSIDNSKTLSEILAQITEVSRLSISLETLANKLKEIFQEAKDGLIPQKQVTYNTLFTNINLLFQQLDAINLITKLSEILGTTDIAVHWEEIEKITDPQSDDEYKIIFEKLKNSNGFNHIFEKISGFPNLLTETESSKQILHTKVDDKLVEPLSHPATAISHSYPELNNFITDSNSFLQMLNKLRGIKEFESIKPVIELGRKLSQSTQNKQKLDFTSIVQNIGELQPKLKTLEAEMNKVKGFKSLETDALMKLDDAKKDSDTIGSATRGISSMSKIVKNPIDMSKLSPVLAAIDAERKTSQVTFSAEEETNMNELSGLIKGVKNLKSGIGRYITSVKTSTSEKVSEHADIFEKASSIKGISMNFQMAIVSIEKLASHPSSSAPDFIRGAIPILEKLDSSGLHFSKIDFKSAKESLNSLEMSFAKFKNFFVATTTTSPVITKKPKGKPKGKAPVTLSPAESAEDEADRIARREWEYSKKRTKDADKAIEKLISRRVPLIYSICVLGSVFLISLLLWVAVNCKKASAKKNDGRAEGKGLEAGDTIREAPAKNSHKSEEQSKNGEVPLNKDGKAQKTGSGSKSGSKMDGVKDEKSKGVSVQLEQKSGKKKNLETKKK